MPHIDANGDVQPGEAPGVDYSWRAFGMGVTMNLPFLKPKPLGVIASIEEPPPVPWDEIELVK